MCISKACKRVEMWRGGIPRVSKSLPFTAKSFKVNGAPSACIFPRSDLQRKQVGQIDHPLLQTALNAVSHTEQAMRGSECQHTANDAAKRGVDGGGGASRLSYDGVSFDGSHSGYPPLGSYKYTV